MLKYIGAVLIFSALIGGAVIYLISQRRRVQTLSGLCAALDMAAGELSARAAPLPLLFELLGQRCEGAAAEFFHTLSGSMDRLGDEELFSLWQGAAEKNLACLNTAEREEIARLGGVLGRYEMEAQLSALHSCEAVLRASLEQARADYPNRRRLGIGMTAAAGALLVIVLL